jgi:transcriptional regulator with GAF, ATPase, and Fis domain
MIRLARLDVEGAGQQLDFAQDLIRLGRAPSNDVALDASHVSAEHASIVFDGSGYVLRDHHSTNGTRVCRGGEVLDLAAVPGRQLRLDTGDTVELGDLEQAVCLGIELLEEPDEARIVSVRRVSELERVEAQVGADRELLRSLYDAQKAISAPTELDDVIDAVAAQVFRFLSRATHVTVALREEEGETQGRYVPVGTRVRDGTSKGEPVPITRSVFRKVVEERAAVLAADAKREVGETASLMAAQIQSTLGVPLWQGDDILGVIQVDNRASSGMFKEPDLDVLAVLGQAASQAFTHARIIRLLRVAEERQRNENQYLKKREQHRRFDGFVGDSPAMQEMVDQLRKVVDTRVTVLIEGETGTGKELVAGALHYWSKRADKLFVAQNCAALPENLLESELFGHKRGAFTGATEDKRGLFELAHNGTLLLDEVGEMPPNLQAKLLRVLQEGEVRPVGSNVTKRVDVRVVAATHRDLEREVAEGRFREDLFYRLRVFPIRVPPLRERREDVATLCNHFLRKYAAEFDRSVGGFGQQAMELLSAYEWPGNVREVENEVQRLVIQADEGGFVLPEHLSPKIRKAENVVERVRPKKGTLKEMVEEVEKWILMEALREHGNNKSATAKTLGITREGLHKKLRGYGLT